MTNSNTVSEDRAVDDDAPTRRAAVNGSAFAAPAVTRGDIASAPRLRSRLIDADDPAWLAFLDGTAHDFYHRPEYAKLEARHEAAQPCALLVEDGQRAMLLPLLIRSVSDVGIDATSPYGYSGPLLRGTREPDFLGEALEAGMPVLERIGIISLFVRMHPLLIQAPQCEIGTLVRHCDTVAVDLQQSSDAIAGGMRRNHRVQIRQAQEMGFVARWDASDAGYEIFKGLYRETMSRLRASEFYSLDDQYFDVFRASLGEHLRLAIIEWEGEVYSAGMFIETCGIVEAHLTGTKADGGSACPKAAKLMFSFAIEESQADGQRWLHLGGGRDAEEDGLFHFKAGFSSLRFPFYTLRIVIDAAKYQRLLADHDADLDPADLTGFFPAYRRFAEAHTHGW